MCGITGIIYRHPKLCKHLGSDLLQLIQPLESRGPDSCGVGLYGNSVASHQLKCLMLADSEVQWETVRQKLRQWADVVKFEIVGAGIYVTLQSKDDCTDEAWRSRNLNLRALAANFPQIHLMSVGQTLEIYKEVGAAENLFQKYDLKSFAGSHGIGHTRMATESVVDTYHSHPFTSAPDLCIVHNGQLSNYYKLRFALEQQGIVFETHNDSEAIAHYIHKHLLQGLSLEETLNHLLSDIDGTFTFLVATSDKVGLVRDRFAAKPAVVYESAEMVAIASEHHCFLNLPSFDPSATIYEPDAGEINIWSIAPTPTPLLELTGTASTI